VTRRYTLKSQDFTVDCFFMKLLETANIDIVRECQNFFGFELPSVIVQKGCNIFVNNYNGSENLLSRTCGNSIY